MLKKCALSLLGGCLSFASFAGSMGMPPPMPMIEVHPWSVTASLGYTSYEYGTEGTGQTPLGRLAIGKSMCDLGRSSFGGELGVQNGNSVMSLFTPRGGANALNSLGGLPVQATVTPLLDLLGTLRVSISENTPLFFDFKLGLAYRRMYTPVTTVNNKSQFAGEFQGGMGVPITDSATLSFLYQGVYGSALDFTVDTANFTGHIQNIPVQNGLLLSLNITL